MAQIRHSPKSAWPRGNYAAFLVNKNRPAEAVEHAEAALAIMPYGYAQETLAEALAILAIHTAHSASPAGVAEAKKHLARARRTSPKPNARVEMAHGAVLFQQAIAEQDPSKVAAGERHLRRALELEPDWLVAKNYLQRAPEFVRRSGG